ncbi:hypothetical protein SG34_019345 [Thalassomonas viridans]|uniref:ShKT domain-containing protein n=1 Tax=Thalassomonas viridans TaxID=137584 RepID=A0AAE9YZN4_9GAMM|nr:hypothetical protein [Thalassomonas viridans]WDE03532.1 hypothetical protein SG34_019345 [Thalassomonas viridans]
MKKKLLTLLVSCGMAVGFNVNAVSCDGTAWCMAVYTDCMNHGYDSNYCSSLYWSCAGTCVQP